MIRISASDLESFRYWKDSEAPQSDLIERLTHAAKPTPQMEAGRAFAKMMERADHDTIGTATVDDWAFDFTAMTAEISIPTLREIKAEKVYATPSGPVTLVAKCDGLTGRTVTDDKLTEKWDAEKYLDSLQWRVYLELFEADRFVYEVFVGKYNLNDDRPAAPGQVPPNRWVDIRDHHRMTFNRYPQLAGDVQRAVNELAAIITEYVPGLVTPDAKEIDKETT